MAFRFPTEKFASGEQLQPFLSLWLRKIFLEDWSTKLIALAITLGLWFAITGQQAPVTSRFNNVQLKFSVPGEMEISNEPLRQVEITLTGDKGKLDRLRDLEALVDLSARAPGEWLVELKPGDVIMELPSGVKIDEIQPGKVLVKLERREEREVEVKPEFEGSLPDGMEVYENETSVTPAKVRVRGPSSFVNSIDTISTEKITLENRNSDFVSKQVAINLVNPRITVLDTVVDVSVRIGPKRSERRFTVQTQTPAGVNENITVTILGAPQDLDKITGKDLRVEWEKISEDSLKPVVSLPDELARSFVIRSTSPSIITIKR